MNVQVSMGCVCVTVRGHVCVYMCVWRVCVSVYGMCVRVYLWCVYLCVCGAYGVCVSRNVCLSVVCVG